MHTWYRTKHIFNLSLHLYSVHWTLLTSHSNHTHTINIAHWSLHVFFAHWSLTTAHCMCTLHTERCTLLTACVIYAWNTAHCSLYACSAHHCTLLPVCVLCTQSSTHCSLQLYCAQCTLLTTSVLNCDQWQCRCVACQEVLTNPGEKWVIWKSGQISVRPQGNTRQLNKTELSRVDLCSSLWGW